MLSLDPSHLDVAAYLVPRPAPLLGDLRDILSLFLVVDSVKEHRSNIVLTLHNSIVEAVADDVHEPEALAERRKRASHSLVEAPSLYLAERLTVGVEVDDGEVDGLEVRVVACNT